MGEFFKLWLNERYPNETDRMNYLSLNHIGNDTSLEFVDFIKFYDKRRAALKTKRRGHRSKPSSCLGLTPRKVAQRASFE